jgi:preprotein translocase subunit SecB
MKHHPIQLTDIQFRELKILVNDPAECQKNDLEAQVVYQVGSHKFPDDQDILMVGFRCLINVDKENAPFELIVDIVGVFTVGEEFPKDKVELFAKQNVPIILMPYIRENVYSLAVRAGINVHLPLVQVPTRSS